MSRRTRTRSTPPPEPLPTERESRSLGQVRNAREALDRERGLLLRAEREVALAVQRRSEAIDAELESGSAAAADATKMAEKALREARARLESAQARSERAQLGWERARKALKDVRHDYATELAVSMEDQLDELREMIAEVEGPLRAIVGKWSHIEGAWERLYQGLADHIVRADAVNGRNRGEDRIKREVVVQSCPLDPATLARLFGSLPRPWCVDPRYEPDTVPPPPTISRTDASPRFVFQGDRAYQRHVHPHATSGEPVPELAWPLARGKSPSELMKEELAALRELS